MTTDRSKTAATAGPPADKEGFSLISNDKLMQLYSTMLKCRMLEERIRTLFKPGKATGSRSCDVGREAGIVGVVIDLGCEDAISPPPRDFIASYVKGAPLDAIFSRLRSYAAHPGRGLSSSSEVGYPSANVLPSPPKTAARLNIASGIAMLNKAHKNNKIAVVICDGEGPTRQGSWHQALSIAGVNDLPILFVCQQEERGKLGADAEGLSLKAKTYGLPVIVVDGNDVVAVYRVASEAIAHARKGNGPTLIECRTDRRAANPILNLERYLASKGLYSEQAKADVTATFTREMDAAIRKAAQS